MTNFFRLQNYFRRSTVAFLLPALVTTTRSNTNSIYSSNTTGSYQAVCPRSHFYSHETPIGATMFTRLTASTAKKPSLDYLFPGKCPPSLQTKVDLSLSLPLHPISHQLFSDYSIAKETYSMSSINPDWRFDSILPRSAPPPLAELALRNGDYISNFESNVSLLVPVRGTLRLFRWTLINHV